MKTTILGAAAAILLGLASFAAPASAAPVSAGLVAEQPMTDVSARRVVRKTIIRPGRVCSVRKVVRRGPMGRRIVTKTRVCR